MTATAQASPVAALLDEVRPQWAPPPDLTVSEFADAHIIVTAGPLQSTRWRTAYAPYQRGILNAFDEPGVEHVIVRGSAAPIESVGQLTSIVSSSTRMSVKLPGAKVRTKSNVAGACPGI